LKTNLDGFTIDKVMIDVIISKNYYLFGLQENYLKQHLAHNF